MDLATLAPQWKGPVKSFKQRADYKAGRIVQRDESALPAIQIVGAAKKMGKKQPAIFGPKIGCTGRDPEDP